MYRLYFECVEDIERNGGEEIEHKPSSNVVESYLPRTVDDLARFTDKRRPKIQHDVCNDNNNGSISYNVVCKVVLGTWYLEVGVRTNIARHKILAPAVLL